MEKWFANQALRGNMYHAADTVAVTLTAINATCTGIILENPSASSVNLIVEKFRFVHITDPGVGSLCLEVQPAVSSTALTSTTPMTIENGLNRGTDVGVGQARAYSAATLPAAPVRLLAMGSSGAAEYADSPLDVMGTLIVVPGMTINLGFLAFAAVGLASVSWAELPVAIDTIS